MRESETQKLTIINRVLKNYDYDFYHKTILSWSHPKTRDEFKKIAGEYGCSFYKIARDYTKAIGANDSDERFNSKEEIYSSSLYRNRKPPKKIVEYFLERHKSIFGLREFQRFNRTCTILSALESNGYDTKKGLDYKSVNDELMNFSIGKLEALEKCINSMIEKEDLELEASDNYPNSFELWEDYITNLSDAALVFLHKNFDVLNEFIGELRVILDGIIRFEDDDFKKLIEQLETKKAHAKHSTIYERLSECEFDNNVHLEPTDRKKILDCMMEHTSEISDYSDLDSFVSLCRKMCHDYQLVWKTILIILMHYGNKPSGKRVSDLFNNYHMKKAAIAAAQIDQSLFNP